MSEFDKRFQSSSLAAHPHERRGGGSLSTRLIRLDSPAHEATDPATSDLVIGLVLAGSAGASWSWGGARPNTTTNRRPGTLGATPIGSVGHFEVDGPSSLLIVALPFGALAKRLEADMALKRDLGPLHDVYGNHPMARRICLRLWSLARHAGAVTDLGIDWLSEQLVVQLAGPPELGLTPPAGGLGPREVDCVRSIAESADVADLASAIAMPVRTFRRRFQTTFGMAPHAWLIARRIELAKRKISDCAVSLSCLALDLGFASQAHFTDVFRRQTGISPGRFRREQSR